MVHVAVLGAYGSAGVAAAEGLLAALDEGRLDTLTLSLIDGGEPGGLCILRGCMPSKDLLSAGGHRFQVRHDDRLGQAPMVDVDRTVTQKDTHVASFVEHRKAGIEAMADRPEVTFYPEHGRFVDASTISVGDEHLEIDYAIIATGSNPTIPPVPGIDDVEVHTSAEVLDATTFPASGVIIGFGFIGMELAPYLAEVGDVDLTVIDRNDRPLSAVDPAFGSAVKSLYEDEFGIELITGASADRIDTTEDGVEVTYRDQTGETGVTAGEQLYVFAGRTPNLDGLSLEAAGLEDRAGWVTDTMATADNPRIFVVGDANGREPILHIAKEEGYHAAENIVATVNGASTAPYEPIIHRIVFSGLSVYPFARVGHSESSAKAAGFDVVTATRQASDDGVFKVKAVPLGLAKLVVDAYSGQILGYLGLHHHADVFAKLAQVMIETGLTVEEIPDRAYHPTTPELLDGLLRETKATIENR